MPVPVPGNIGSWAVDYTKYTGDTNILMSGSGYQSQGLQIQDSSRVYLRGVPGPAGANLMRAWTFGQARSLPLTWAQEDPGQLQRFVNTGILRKIRGFNVNMGMPEILDAWENMLEQSWRMNQATGITSNDPENPEAQASNPWTPFDVMETYSNAGNFGTVKSSDGNWMVDAQTGERVKYVGPKSKTTKESRINLSSPEEVRALTTSMLSEMLGRAPTAEEMAKYKASINDYERSNPQTATTTVTLNDMGEQVSSNTITSGGASQAALQEIVSGGAKEGPEYGKYQGGARYFNLLERLVGGG